MWGPGTIAGLSYVTDTFYSYRSNQIVLAGGGTFTYDDTVFDAVPNGLFKTLATCAVNNPDDPTQPSGGYVQLLLSFVNELGRDYSTTVSPGTTGGTITAFSASMRGRGALEAVSDADGSDITTDLPWDTLADGTPSVYLLRPTALTWPGQDPANDANRTVWSQREIDVVTFGFSVSSRSADIQPNFDVTGLTTGGTALPTVFSTILAGEQQAGLLPLPA